MLRCQLCQAEFKASKPTAKFCSSRCRSASWQRERAQAQAEREGRVRMLLAEALRVLEGQEGGAPGPGGTMGDPEG